MTMFILLQKNLNIKRHPIVETLNVLRNQWHLLIPKITVSQSGPKVCLLQTSSDNYTESGDSPSYTYTDLVWRWSLWPFHWLTLETLSLLLTLTESGDSPSDAYTDWVRRLSLWYFHWPSLEMVPLTLSLAASEDGPSDTYIGWVWRRPLRN